MNPRTANRHLPAGTLSVRAVALFVLLCLAGFFTATFLFVLSNQNWLPVYLAIPVTLFIGAYSYTKRFTALSHYWLGASLMLAPVAAWIAIQGNLDGPPVVLGLAVLCWVGGFDVLYACQDVDFDREAGLRSLPAKLGVHGSLRLAMLSHAVMIALLLSLWWVAGLGVIYLLGLAAAAVLLAYEHWLVRPDDLSRVNLAFFHLNSLISVGLLIVISFDLWLG